MLTTTRTPIFGTRADQAGAIRAGAAAVVITSMYVAAVRTWSPDLSPTGLEIFGTITSLACVWLTRSQNIWSVIYGLVSVVAMGIFFFDIDLVGQGWLHLGYYIPVQVVGWWAWLRGGDGRTELPVGWLSPTSRSVLGVSTVLGALLLAVLFRELHGETPYLLWDTSIVAASVSAQLLLMAKRIESWFLWLLPGDVSAVLLYMRTDAEMFAALYCVYLGLATLGLRDWVRAWRAQESGLSAFDARNALAAGT